MTRIRRIIHGIIHHSHSISHTHKKPIDFPTFGCSKALRFGSMALGVHSHNHDGKWGGRLSPVMPEIYELIVIECDRCGMKNLKSQKKSTLRVCVFKIMYILWSYFSTGMICPKTRTCFWRSFGALQRGPSFALGQSTCHTEGLHCGLEAHWNILKDVETRWKMLFICLLTIKFRF